MIDPAHSPPRSRAWLRWLCFNLMSATLVMYAMRTVVTQNALPIQKAFGIEEKGYGKLAGDFGLGFAVGQIVFGLLADYVSVRWLYPAVVLAWSLAGALSGWVTTFPALCQMQFLMGLFQAGHWPCSLRTTQRLFTPELRTWGNSLLQSGASLGAIVAPLLVAGLWKFDPSVWRWAFFLVAALGVPWAIWWLAMIRDADLNRPPQTTNAASPADAAHDAPFWTLFLERRWWLMLVVVIAINLLWHYIRVWIAPILEKDYGYEKLDVQFFTSAYYAATFAGGLGAGWLSVRLARGGAVHRARLIVFALCAFLGALAIPAAFAPRGPLPLVLLLFVGAGSLGLFPVYYSLNQELSARNQGKVSGSLGFSTWVVSYFLHPAVGALVDARPTSRPYILASVGAAPLVALAFLLLFWKQPSPTPALEAKTES